VDKRRAGRIGESQNRAREGREAGAKGYRAKIIEAYEHTDTDIEKAMRILRKLLTSPLFDIELILILCKHRYRVLGE
jgi:hypothetical protein